MPIVFFLLAVSLILLIEFLLPQKRSLSKTAGGGRTVPVDGLDTNLAVIATTVCTGLAASHAALLYMSITLSGERLWTANGGLGEILPLVSLFTIQA